MDPQDLTLILRFRDMVTEPGGTIDEHRRIVALAGHAWWGWWWRQFETVPRASFSELLAGGASKPVSVLLFNSSTLSLYPAQCQGAVVAPPGVRLQSPEFEATPEYCLRGAYPAWFDLVAIAASPLDDDRVSIVSRPTMVESDSEALAATLSEPEVVSLSDLRDDQATLWLGVHPTTSSE